MSIKFDNGAISRIQQANDIVEVVSEHLSLDKRGKEFVGLCPFHQDHRPSFYVSDVKQIFKCFACGAGGDVFKFVQLRENVTFPQAIARLAERAGIKLDTVPVGSGSQRDVDQADPSMIARINGWAQKYWQSNLSDEQKGDSARAYLRSRQINEQSCTEWNLGLSLDRWDGLLGAGRARKIGEKPLIQAGLIVAGNDDRCYDKFRNRLMFPIADVTGRVIGFGGRTLGDDPAKYMNSPATVLFDKSNCVYGLDKARHQIAATGTAVVVEGYTDVIMAHQFGCRNVVAALGTSFTDGHARLLRRYAKRIVLIFDSDIAGTEAANRAIEVCLHQKVDMQLTFVSDGKDPCDYLLSAGPEAFTSLVDNAVDVMEFKWQRFVDSIGDSDNQTDRRAMVEEYLRSVALAGHGQGTDMIAQGLINAKLCRITGLSEQQLRHEIAKVSGKLARGRAYTVKDRKVVNVDLGRGYYAAAQREVIEILLNEPGLMRRCKDRINFEQFDVDQLRRIAEVLFEMFEHGRHISAASVLTHIEDVDTAGIVTELQHRGQAKGNFTERLDKALEIFAQRDMDSRRRQIKATMDEGCSDERLREMHRILGKGNSRSPGMTTG